jgi:5-methyltetrahydrofolate--homocysteine methyltransferase
MSDLIRLTEAVKTGDGEATCAEVRAAIDAGLEPGTILDTMVTALHDVGESFKQGEIFVPEMLVAARAMKAAMPLLEPLLIEAGVEPDRIAVIGTVEGDIHDIGKNLVALMWGGASLRVIDLGVNVPAQRFVEAVDEHAASVVGLSALLTTTMPAMEKIVGSLREAASDAKVVIGGAPVTREYAEKIGADGYAADAGDAVDVVRELL